MSDIQSLYETLKVIRKGSEDDFELRASDDKKTWGVKLTGDGKPTYAIYAGPDAKDYASDLADYDADDEDIEETDEDDDDDDMDDEDDE